ncbi:MAG: hypothetical protein OXE84_01830 [Rhodobacteraceae bacterium]|nr:hypothetical protein [Paracoccaceae bacterium]
MTNPIQDTVAQARQREDKRVGQSRGETLNRLDKQTLCLRYFAIALGLIALIFLTYLELEIRDYIITRGSHAEGLFYVWAVSPVVAGTTILVAMLTGVFRTGRPNIATDNIDKLFRGNGSGGE